VAYVTVNPGDAAAMSEWSFDSVITFIEAHRSWAGAIFGLMAFGESLAFIGVLIPATSVLMASGALIGAGILSFWEVWLGGAIGAAIGDAVSFWLGRVLGPKVERLWPFNRRPQLLAAAERMFKRWGAIAVFAGRFIGPMRATVPLAAGILGMPHLAFQIVNILSAIVWIPVLVAPGAGIAWLVALGADGHGSTAILLGAALAAGLVLLWLIFRRPVAAWLNRTKT
jgi:membrane protein DedA with SNARE-associated domain